MPCIHFRSILSVYLFVVVVVFSLIRFKYTIINHFYAPHRNHTIYTNLRLVTAQSKEQQKRETLLHIIQYIYTRIHTPMYRWTQT